MADHRCVDYAPRRPDEWPPRLAHRGDGSTAPHLGAIGAAMGRFSALAEAPLTSHGMGRTRTDHPENQPETRNRIKDTAKTPTPPEPPANHSTMDSGHRGAAPRWRRACQRGALVETVGRAEKRMCRARWAAAPSAIAPLAGRSATGWLNTSGATIRRGPGERRSVWVMKLLGCGTICGGWHLPLGKEEGRGPAGEPRTLGKRQKGDAPDVWPLGQPGQEIAPSRPDYPSRPAARHPDRSSTVSARIQLDEIACPCFTQPRLKIFVFVFSLTLARILSERVVVSSIPGRALAATSLARSRRGASSRR